MTQFSVLCWTHENEPLAFIYHEEINYAGWGGWGVSKLPFSLFNYGKGLKLQTRKLHLHPPIYFCFSTNLQGEPYIHKTASSSVAWLKNVPQTLLHCACKLLETEACSQQLAVSNPSSSLNFWTSSLAVSAWTVLACSKKRETFQSRMQTLQPIILKRLGWSCCGISSNNSTVLMGVHHMNSRKWPK